MELYSPSLIILDVVMPGLGGFEHCRQLKSRAEMQDIPVIFISALDDKSNKLEGFRVGGVDYITKPFQREEVLARVNAHIDKSGNELWGTGKTGENGGHRSGHHQAKTGGSAPS